MGNSKKPEGTGRKGKKKKIVQKNQEAYLARTGTTVADAGVAARRALAIQRGGLEAAEGIRNRALKQRDESRAETAEAKSSLQAVSHQLFEQKGKLNLEQDLRHESDAALAHEEGVRQPRSHGEVQDVQHTADPMGEDGGILSSSRSSSSRSSSSSSSSSREVSTSAFERVRHGMHWSAVSHRAGGPTRRCGPLT